MIEVLKYAYASVLGVFVRKLCLTETCHVYVFNNQATSKWPQMLLIKQTENMFRENTFISKEFGLLFI